MDLWFARGRGVEGVERFRFTVRWPGVFRFHSMAR